MFVLWLLLKSWLVWLWLYCASFSRKTRDFPGNDWLNPIYLNCSIQFTSKLSIYFVTDILNNVCPKTRFPRLPWGTKITALVFVVAEHPSTSTFHRGSLQLWRIINYLSANSWHNLFHCLFASEFSSDYTSFGYNIWSELLWKWKTLSQELHCCWDDCIT